MKEHILAIYEREEAYANHLSGYLNRSPGFPYRVAVFTSRESLVSYLEQETVDILLLGEECAYEADLLPAGEEQRIILTADEREDLEEPWIFKYQSAGNIMREIVAYAAEPGIMEEGGAEIYGVFATRGGQERSEYTAKLLRELRKQGEVLYVNMDLFPPVRKGGENNLKGMSEAVYYLKQNQPQSHLKIRTLIKEENGIRMIHPAHCSMDLLELTPEDIVAFFKVLRDMKEYSYIVLELGFYSKAMLELCRFCHTVYLVTPSGHDYAGSTQFFLEQLALMQYEGIERKVKIIQYGGAAEKTTIKSTATAESGFFQRVER